MFEVRIMIIFGEGLVTRVVHNKVLGGAGNVLCIMKIYGAIQLSSALFNMYAFDIYASIKKCIPK